MTRVVIERVTCGACGATSEQSRALSVFVRHQTDLEDINDSFPRLVETCAACGVVTDNLVLSSRAELQFQKALLAAWSMSRRELLARTLLRRGRLLDAVRELALAAHESQDQTQSRSLRLEAAAMAWAAISLEHADSPSRSIGHWCFAADTARRGRDFDLAMKLAELLSRAALEPEKRKQVQRIAELARAGDSQRAYLPTEPTVR